MSKPKPSKSVRAWAYFWKNGGFPILHARRNEFSEPFQSGLVRVEIRRILPRKGKR